MQGLVIWWGPSTSLGVEEAIVLGGSLNARKQRPLLDNHLISLQR